MTEEKTLTMKDLEGKEVFLRPTGNNRRPSKPKEIIPAKNIKMARVYATFIIDGAWCDYEKLDRETITKVANLLGIQIGD